MEIQVSKKVLFIDARSGSDFTMDAVWAGLVERYGWENVIDWPASDKHREGIPKITGDVEKDYGAERRSLCYTKHFDKFPRYTRDDVNNLIRSGSIECVFIDERDESFRLYCQTVARFSKIPVVVVAGHDRFWNSSVRVLCDMYRDDLIAIFMDNWRPEYDNTANRLTLPTMYPMSYATNFDHLWEVNRRQEFLNNKVYDICFLGYSSHPDRALIVDYLAAEYRHLNNKLFVERRPNTMDAFLPKSEYFKIMAQSKICINLLGAAECGKALRFYEIPYVGSFMLSQTFKGRQVAPFHHLKHCMYWSDFRELKPRIDRMLADPQERETIARQGHEHAMLNHTAGARVDYMFQKIGSKLANIGR